MDLDYLKKHQLIILDCISGSRAYGLDTKGSDTDIKGLFVAPKARFYGFDTGDHVANESNDIVYFEIRKFFDLLTKSNPNVLELINSPEDCTRYRHPLLDAIDQRKIISKKCFDSFARYAIGQIKKAKGLNKKIFNPFPKEKRDILEFCFVTKDQHPVPLPDWLESNNIHQENCGLAKLNHFANSYLLYYEGPGNPYHFRGIIRKDISNDVCSSSIPKGLTAKCFLNFNIDEYKKYNKEYNAYWNWVKKRNDERYSQTVRHGRNYDAKNMMHTFRLLNMADEIATEKRINVRRKDRDFLLKIKGGEYEYETLLEMAQQKIAEIEHHFSISDLPESPDIHYIESLLVQTRDRFYRERKG